MNNKLSLKLNLMKKTFIILLIALLGINSCDSMFDDKKTGLQFSFSTKNKTHGEFTGEFVRAEEGEWRKYVFRSGNGNTLSLANFPENEDNHYGTVSGEPYRSEKSALKDSLDRDPALFSGRILRVKWTSIIDRKDPLNIKVNGTRVVEALAYPEVK